MKYINTYIYLARIHRENEKKTDNKSDERASNLKELLDLSVNWNYVNGINYLFENKEVDFIFILFNYVINIYRQLITIKNGT